MYDSFCRDGNKYSACGTYGLALIHGADCREIMIYKDKQNILTRAKLLPAFIFTLQANNFSTFYDDNKQNWSVRFNTSSESEEFLNELKKIGIQIVKDFKESQQNTEDQCSSKDEVVDASAIPDNSQAALKADILTRMAKMGQPILPTMKTGISDDVSDSDSDVVKNKKLSKKFKRPGDKQPQILEKPAVLEPYSDVQQHSVTSVIPIQTTVPQAVNFSAITPSFDPLNILLAENRTQNTEIRINLSHLSNKLDEVLWKINQSDGSEERLLKSKLKAMELKVANLYKELEEAVNDNISLQEKVAALKDNKCNRSLEDLLQQKNVEIEQLKKELADKDSALAKREEFKKFSFDLCTDLNTIHLVDFESFYEKHKDNKEFLKEVYISMLKKLVDQNTKICFFEQNTNKINVNIDSKIDSVFAELYSHILKHFDASSGTMPADFILNGLQRNLKTTANYIKQEYKKECDLFESNKPSVVKVDDD